MNSSLQTQYIVDIRLISLSKYERHVEKVEGNV